MVPRRVTSQFIGSSVLLSRIQPPPLPADLLSRPRVTSLLASAAEHRLAILHAPAGWGKTVALAELGARGGWALAWCRLHGADTADLLTAHLVAACAAIMPAVAEHVPLDGAAEQTLVALINMLALSLDDDLLLVLDDFQLIDDRPELRATIDRLIEMMPPRLHLILAGRIQPALGSLPTARARGDVVMIDADDLAFTEAETRALFSQRGSRSVARMVQQARGWPLAIHLLASDADAQRLPELLDPYLAHDVIDVQPDTLRAFVLASAQLRWLDPQALSVILALDDAGPLLDELQRRGLFVERSAAGQLAYQPLFQAAILRIAATRLSDLRGLHMRAVGYYHTTGDAEGALHHLLAIDDRVAAGRELVQHADDWLAHGKAATLQRWIERIGEIDEPALILASATALRQLGRFREALARYVEAESAFEEHGDIDGRVRALRGQAAVFLDSVQPALADAPLKRALKLLPRSRQAERAELLHLQAENWANRGRADVSLLLEASARRIAHSDEHELPPRLLLRSGRLDEARRQLEALLPSDEPRPLGAHREPPLLLALIYTLLGNGVAALAMARRGLLEAQGAESQLTEAIAQMRLGHAFQLTSTDPAPAQQHYERALALLETVGVERTKAEVYLGMVLLRGHQGDLAVAEAAAEEGLRRAEQAGDDWTAALLWLALGSIAVDAGDDRGVAWLDEAERRFRRGGDTYGLALVALWRSLRALQHHDAEQARPQIEALLELVMRHGYQGLLSAPTLFGPRDLLSLVPVLLQARSMPAYGSLAHQLLRVAFPSIATDPTIVEYHPGFTLRVQMLGGFRIWRGRHEIQDREWGREKARQLLQLLLTFRGRWLQREQICAWLWPDADLQAAERQFKVTLNALNSALEPQRPARTAPFFIRRQGLAYSFAPALGCWIDVDEFELRLSSGVATADRAAQQHNALIAVRLYRGDYLPETLYDAWTLDERERLLARFLTAATNLAAQLVDQGATTQAIDLAEQVLRRDQGYEEAYQVLMRAFARSGNRSQAMRAYDRCVRALRTELEIEPLPETIALYEQIKHSGSV